MAQPRAKARTVADVFPAFQGLEGAGFPVRRPFPTPLLPQGLDPFVLLDHMGPTDWAPGEAKGAPDHPHRGFETVTYILGGRLRHRDSLDNTGVLGQGDVQWMTAGAGIVHSEMPHEDILKEGGRMHGFQLWVNLPRAQKWVRPRYQDTPSPRMPVVLLEGGEGSVKVVAGEALGAQAVIETRIPILLWHVQLEPGAEFRHAVPRDFSLFAYVAEGAGRFGRDATEAAEGEIAVFRPDGEDVLLRAREGFARPLSVLLIGGRPIGEPVAHYGPFVMSTREEILQAIRDYQAGRMGQIAPEIG